MDVVAPHGRVCRDCKWFNGSECRRFPPTWVSWPNDNQHPVIYWPQSSYPMVGPDQWCGEFTATRGPDEATNTGAVDPRDPDHSLPGIFATHNCWKCKDGTDLSRCPTPDRPGNCGYPHARND